MRNLRRISCLSVAMCLVAVVNGLPARAAERASLQLKSSVKDVEFGNIAVNASSAPQIIELKNSGNTNALIQRVFASSEEFSLTQNCSTGKPLAAGDNCSISVTFSPQETGGHKGIIAILVQDFGQMNIPLTGNGVESSVVLSQNHMVFRDQLVNTQGDMQMLRLENRSDTPLTIKHLAASPEFALLPAQDQCPATGIVPAKGSCVVAIAFSPRSEGILHGTITINDSDPASPHRIGLSGRATSVKLSAPALTWKSTPLGTSGSEQQVQISNSGSAALRIEGFQVRGAFAEQNTCTKELGVNQSCAVTVVFQPKSIGASTGSILVRDSDVTAIQTIFLNGMGVALELTPIKLDFGTQTLNNPSPSQSVMLTNHGPDGVPLRSISVTGDFVMPAKSCGEVLESNRSCKVSLSFSPSTEGPHSGTFSVESGSGAAQTIALTGVGTPAR